MVFDSHELLANKDTRPLYSPLLRTDPFTPYRQSQWHSIHAHSASNSLPRHATRYSYVAERRIGVSHDGLDGMFDEVKIFIGHTYALPVLKCLRFSVILHFATLRLYDSSYRVEIHAEELLSEIDPIHSLLVQLPVQRIFQSWGVVARDHHVNVKRKGHGCVAKLTDSVLRFKPSRHADLVHSLPEGTDVGET